MDRKCCISHCNNDVGHNLRICMDHSSIYSECYSHAREANVITSHDKTSPWYIFLVDMGHDFDLKDAKKYPAWP